MNKVTSFIFLLLISCLAHSQKANLVIPMGHAQKINQLEVNHDRRHLVSVDDSNIIHIWDTKTNREIFQLKDHPEGIVNVQFHPDKDELISSDFGGNIYIWEYTNSKVVRKINTDQSSPAVCYFDGGSKLVSAGGSSVKTWNVADGTLISEKTLDETISKLEVSPFSSNFIVGFNSGMIKLIDPSMTEIYSTKFGNAKVTSITGYPDKEKLLIGYEDGMIHSINVDKDKLAEEGQLFQGTVGKILLDHETGRIVAAGNDPNGYIKFLKTSLEDETPSRFRWASVPKDELGLRALAWASKSYNRMYVANHDNVIVKWKTKEEEWAPGNFKGTARPIYDIDLDGSKEKLVIASRHGQLKIYDLTGATYPILLDGHDGGISQLDYHPDKNLVVVAGRDGEIKIWNTEQLELKERIKKAPYLDFNIQFTVDRNVIRKIQPDVFEVSNFRTKKSQNLSVPGALDMKISPDGEIMVFRKANELVAYTSYDLSLSFKVPVSGARDFTFAGDEIAVLLPGGKIEYYQKELKTKGFNSGKFNDRINGLSNGEIITYSSEDSRSLEYTAFHFSPQGKQLNELVGHSDYITEILEYNENLLSASLDGSIKIWNRDKDVFTDVGSFIPLRKDDFVITTPDQLFDASPGAMTEMHYTRGGDIIALDQLKDTYYEPNLLPQLIGYGSGQLRKPQDISELGIYPDMEIKHPNLNNGKLGVVLSNKGGGIGRVVLTINGKEVESDLRPNASSDANTLEIEYDINGHPYLLDGKVNKITIKAYNSDGTLGSEPHNILVLPSNEDKEEIKSKIFAVIIGSSDYANDELDLKYAAKDAEDFAFALKMSSSNLIGGENLKMSLLTTNQDKSNWPTKENIKKAFAQYSKEAKARDYLIVYMSGHGTNSTGENSDFYYLTCTTEEGRISDEKTRTQDAISSKEFTEYIKTVPALKQVMIVDACHSGKLTSTLSEEKVSKSMNSDEVKALEKMKDRTGLFLLAGSAADAVSYETTLYGQGLLTYALLFGMKGAALRDGEYIDVLDLFQFAAKKVPQLAEDIGGIQRPEVRVPSDAESFDIGKMNNEHKSQIKLLSPKPVFVHTSFQDEKKFIDESGLGYTLDNKLAKISKTPNAPLVYMNENRFSGAMQVKGRYQQKGLLTIVDVKVYQDQTKVTEFKVDGTNANSIADKIIARLMKVVEK